MCSSDLEIFSSRECRPGSWNFLSSTGSPGVSWSFLRNSGNCWVSSKSKKHIYSGLPENNALLYVSFLRNSAYFLLLCSGLKSTFTIFFRPSGSVPQLKSNMLGSFPLSPILLTYIPASIHNDVTLPGSVTSIST